MSEPNNYWLDGIVKINGDDLLMIGRELDGPVKIDMNANQISHAGSRPVDVFTDETKSDTTITLSGAVLSMRMLNYLMGMKRTIGVSDDGITPAAVYSFNGKDASFGRRPYVELLATGNRPGTVSPTTGVPYKLEIEALRAKLMGVFSMVLDKDNYTKLELVFKLHADPNDADVNFLQIRDEQLDS